MRRLNYQRHQRKAEKALAQLICVASPKRYNCYPLSPGSLKIEHLTNTLPPNLENRCCIKPQGLCADNPYVEKVGFDKMSHELRNAQHSDLTEDLPGIQGVCFDPDSVTLQGVYSDELSLFRARKIWTATLEATFLLEGARDFRFDIFRSYEAGRFVLRCAFLSACGRYAFWRLTNNQAPEAQYEIETAHIPDSLSHHQDFVSAPDLKPVSNTPLVMGEVPRATDDAKSFAQWLHSVINRLSKTF